MNEGKSIFTIGVATAIASLAIGIPLSAQTPPQITAWSDRDFRPFISDKAEFKKDFESLNVVRKASEGGTYNSELKYDSEVIVMRPVVCTNAMSNQMIGMVPPAGYAPFRMWASKSPKDQPNALIAEFLTAFKAASQTELGPRKVRDDFVTKILALAAKKTAADTSGQRIIPVEIASMTGSRLALESADTGAQEIGGRINDGYILDMTNPCSGNGDSNALRKVFGDSGVPNGFADTARALQIAAMFPEITMVVEHGGKFWLYRRGDVNLDKLPTLVKDIKLKPGYKLRQVVGAPQLSGLATKPPSPPAAVAAPSGQPLQTTVTASNGVQLVKMVDQAKGISAYSIAGLNIDSGLTGQIAPDKTDIRLILAKAGGQHQITVEGRFASHFKIEISDYPKQVDNTKLENGSSLMARYDYRMEATSMLDLNHTLLKILIDPAKIEGLAKDKDIVILLQPSIAGDPQPWKIKIPRKAYAAILEYVTKD